MVRNHIIPCSNMLKSTGGGEQCNFFAVFTPTSTHSVCRFFWGRKCDVYANILIFYAYWMSGYTAMVEKSFRSEFIFEWDVRRGQFLLQLGARKWYQFRANRENLPSFKCLHWEPPNFDWLQGICKRAPIGEHLSERPTFTNYVRTP